LLPAGAEPPVEFKIEGVIDCAVQVANSNIALAIRKSFLMTVAIRA
jgi:hypothetical protein